MSYVNGYRCPLWPWEQCSITSPGYSVSRPTLFVEPGSSGSGDYRSSLAGFGVGTCSSTPHTSRSWPSSWFERGGRILWVLRQPEAILRRSDTPRIGEAKPHIVWCAFGAPKQELWMYRNEAALAPALVLGVGAAFDFHAGTKKRAPVWMQRAGLEWLHRLYSEPRRLLIRYVTTNSEFLARASIQLTKRGRR